MRVIIAGSRSLDPSDEQIDAALHRLMVDHELCGITSADVPEFVASKITAVVCGDAIGSDKAGERWARSRRIPVHHEPISEEDVRRWGKYLAPKMRNRRMAEVGDALVAFWDGKSNGTTDMITRMVLRGKPVEVVPTKPEKRRRRARNPVCCPRFEHGDGGHDAACPTLDA